MPRTHIEVDEFVGLVVMTELEPLVKAARHTIETSNMAKRASQPCPEERCSSARRLKDHRCGRVTWQVQCSHRCGRVTLPVLMRGTGADPRTDQKRKGPDPRTGAPKYEK